MHRIIRDSMPGAKIVVLEKEQKPGKKLLATGNGRCNLTNLNMSPDCYNPGAEIFIKSVIERVTPEKLIEWLGELGLKCKADSAGRVYPYSNQAATVLDVLLMWIERLGVEIVCGVTAESVIATKDGFSIKSGERVFSAKKLVLSTGGKVQKALGSDGSSYNFAKQLGLKCSPVFPSLAPIPVVDKELRFAKGVRTASVVSLFADGKVLKTETGELQLNEKNISGICIFQLSRYVGEYFSGSSRYKSIVIKADLAPEYTFGEVTDYFRERRKAFPEAQSAELFTGFLNRKLGIYLLRRCKIADKPLGTLSDRELRSLAELVKKCSFEPSAMPGEGFAQVTAGGISLSEIGRDFQCKKHPGLYILGEALDVDGICGGYNLHFAFSGAVILEESFKK